ncbi:hypothetical protein KGY79_13425 [Candidatus Bipolaricaulota bacterium]|nr:hypothetical protein [Candidatus Bipolaricaulota bacterium]
MVGKKSVVLAVVVIILVLPILANAQSTSYEDFFKEFIKDKAGKIQEDADQFEKVLDQWEQGEVSQSTVVAKLKEIESRADTYFEEVLRLPAPQGNFQKYKQSIYSFVTWYNIIGMFADGMSDLNMSKLDAAVALSNYFQAKTDQFEEELISTD